jgi:hypothetical protein
MDGELLDYEEEVVETTDAKGGDDADGMPRGKSVTQLLCFRYHTKMY